MAANMMEILKRIQCDLADQKNYMRNLHAINKNLSEKLNFMEEQVRDLPLVLVTIGRLEQQVKKNNMLLFGNDETENHFENRTLVPYKPDPDDNNAEHLVEPSEKYMENTEETQLPNFRKVSHIEETEFNNKETKKEDNFQRTDKYKDEAGEFITNEIREIKKMIKDFIEIRHTSVDEAATCHRQDAGISHTNLDTDHQVRKLDDKLNNITKVYESDMREIKELINDSIAISKKSFEDTSKTLLKQETVKEPSISFSAEQIRQLRDEFKCIADMTQSKTSEIKDIIEDSVAVSKMSIQESTELRKQDNFLRETNQSAMREIQELIKDLAKKMPVEEAASTIREQEIVKISPTYFSAVQLSKLNRELKQIANTYQDTNIFPIVEVIPGAAEKHPVMKHLCEGVYYQDIQTGENYFKVKLGVDGLKRSDIIDLITDYLYLSINDVVREWMIATKTWDLWRKDFHWQPYQLRAGYYCKLYLN